MLGFRFVSGMCICFWLLVLMVDFLLMIDCFWLLVMVIELNVGLSVLLKLIVIVCGVVDSVVLGVGFCVFGSVCVWVVWMMMKLSVVSVL